MAKKRRLIFLIIFFICLFVQVIPVIRSGLTTPSGISFWGPNGHDEIWHLSLINHISNPLSIKMPVFSGENLKNYHPFFDILIAYLSKITFINSSFWLFQLFPVISASLFIYFSFRLGLLITQKFSGGIILMILSCAGNSFGWLVSLFRSGSLGGESLFWAMQAPSNQLNPPFALSLLLLTLLIFLLLKNNGKLNKADQLIIFFILVFLPVIKIYSALPAFIIFFVFSLKNRHYFLNLIFSLIFAFLLFIQFNPLPSSLLVFRPLWFANSLIESPDRFYLPQFASMRYSLESTGILGPRLLTIYFLSFLAFIVGNLAWRCLSILDWFKNKSWFNLAIFISSFFLILIPNLFIQSGTSWNTIQFLYYALFLLNIPLCHFLIGSKQKLLTAVIFLSLIFPLLGSLPSFLGNPAPASISSTEFSALSFLSSQPKGIVLTYPYDKFLKTIFPKTPIPLYAYETTSYVSAYSRQITYLEDEMNLSNSGFDWQPRRQNSLNFFSQRDIFKDRGFLINNQIDYIYLTGVQKDKVNLNVQNLYLTKIFENSQSLIYRVQR
jgi:hypothetical protein